MGERLHKVLGQTDLGTLDSGERSLPFGLLVYERVRASDQIQAGVKRPCREVDPSEFYKSPCGGQFSC